MTIAPEAVTATNAAAMNERFIGRALASESYAASTNRPDAATQRFSLRLTVLLTLSAVEHIEEIVGNADKFTIERNLSGDACSFRK
jgi:hypothetical protein